MFVVPVLIENSAFLYNVGISLSFFCCKRPAECLQGDSHSLLILWDLSNYMESCTSNSYHRGSEWAPTFLLDFVLHSGFRKTQRTQKASLLAVKLHKLTIGCCWRTLISKSPCSQNSAATSRATCITKEGKRKVSTDFGFIICCAAVSTKKQIPLLDPLSPFCRKGQQ